MERSGALLNRASAAFSAVTGADTNPTLEQIQTEMAPRMSAHEDAIYLDAKLFGRVEAVYQRRATLGLGAEDLRLVEVLHDRFVRAGAKLNDADKAKMKALNEEESKLTNAFNRRLLAATKAGGYVTTEIGLRLQGMSEAQIAAAGGSGEGSRGGGICGDATEYDAAAGAGAVECARRTRQGFV